MEAYTSVSLGVYIVAALFAIATAASSTASTFETPPPTVVCESDYGAKTNFMNISCPIGTLQIYSAYFGRTVSGSVLCPYPYNADATRDTNCVNSVLGQVQGQCDGLPSCSILVSISRQGGPFADPCVGTYKYLQVGYNCIGSILAV